MTWWRYGWSVAHELQDAETWAMLVAQWWSANWVMIDEQMEQAWAMREGLA